MPIKPNDIVSSIVTELKSLNKSEQEELLVKLRAKRLLRKKRAPFSNPEKNTKPASMQQIDKWKHESRKA
jgi:hypothetical protein